MGQNMVGWCRLKVQGTRGAEVTLRHAETLRPDGTLYLDNIRGAKVTDSYTLKGADPEVWEPRFTYHGFRYVELQGYPGKPTLNTLKGCVVNDDLETAGTFVCSNPLLNQNLHKYRLGRARQLPKPSHGLPTARRAPGLAGRPVRRVKRRGVSFRSWRPVCEVGSGHGRCPAGQWQRVGRLPGVLSALLG